MPAPIDITNHQYGRLKALSLSEKKGNGRFWRCECSCGNLVTVSLLHLRSGHTKSCGCLKSTRLPKGEASFHALLVQYKRNARMRGLSFTLSKSEFRHLVSQNCKYCGIKPSTILKSKYGTGDFHYNGLDRVDNAKGYTKSNSLPCCKICNFMKKKLDYQVFLEHVSRISKHLKLNK